jgi:glutaredoxin
MYPINLDHGNTQDGNQSVTGVKRLYLFLCFFLCFISAHTLAYSFIEPPQEGICLPEATASKECAEPQNNPPEYRPPAVTTNSNNKKAAAKSIGNGSGNASIKPPAQRCREFVVYFFWGRGCPHCEEEKVFLRDMKKQYPCMKIMDYEVWYNKQNASLFASMVKAYHMKTSGVPFTFIGNNAFIGYSENRRQEIEEMLRICLTEQCINPLLVAQGKITLHRNKPGADISQPRDDLECADKSKTVFIPWVGKLDATEMSLPLMTLVIAGLDSFNPCAFFVLFSLLGILIHARSRKKMLLIGSEFVFFSGFIYFLFMAAWLNMFLFMGEVKIITKMAGIIAVLIAAVNIKDFFAFKKGVSLTIPDSAKPKLFDRMRKLMKSTSLISIITGTAILAIAANSYELLCTAGFPMVYTRILTLNNLSPVSYYLYLALYNLIYVIPLSVIVLIFTVTLGRKNLSEHQGRLLKLVSGTMMLGLGSALLINPEILNSAFVSFLLLAGALSVAGLVVLVTGKLRASGE